MIPQFICVGAAKSGTTSLQHILKQHPEVFLPEIKELHFFNKTENYSKGLEWYHRFFDDAKEGQLAGEITPDYMFSQEALSRMAKDLPKDIKLIFMLREPAKRAFSDHHFFYRRGNIDIANFREAIANDVEAIKSGKNPRENRGVSFRPITKSLYSLHIAAFLEHFPLENMFFIRFEDDFIKQPEQCMKDLYKFLQISDHQIVNTEAQNQAFQPKYRWVNKIIYDKDSVLRTLLKKVVPSLELQRKIRGFIVSLNSSKDAQKKLSKGDHTWLYHEFFKEDIQKTEVIINKDLSSWKLD